MFRRSLASLHLHLQFFHFRDTGPMFFSDYESEWLQREVCCELKHVNNAEGMLLINAAT